jgi:hypothetical protein
LAKPQAAKANPFLYQDIRDMNESLVMSGTCFDPHEQRQPFEQFQQNSSGFDTTTHFQLLPSVENCSK